ncbi:MAG: polysaccharide pyruvyl transferase family protein [Alphaproteobacteria bacterium]
MRIGLLNYADVHNFGDVLFPLLAARELRARLPEAEIAFISPSGASVAGMAAERFDRAALADFDALLLCGGEVVHRLDAMLNGIYARFGHDAIARPTDLVFGWTAVAGPYKAWVGLGVPEPDDEARRAIGAAVRGLDFISVRGARSRERLIACGAAAERVRLDRDIGWLFPRLLQGRPPPPQAAGGQPYLAVQAIAWPDTVGLADRLAAIGRRLGVGIVLLPLTTCWGDHAFIGRLYEAGRGAFTLVDHRTDPLDKLAILGGARAYIGQSMHGFVGAAAHGRPAGLLVADADDKFRELLAGARLDRAQAGDLAALDGLAARLLGPCTASFREAADEGAAAGDALFDAVASGLKWRGGRRHNG